MREAGPAFQRNLDTWRPARADPRERTESYRRLRAAVVARDGAEAERVMRAQHDVGCNCVSWPTWSTSNSEPVDDDYVDAVFEMMRDPEAVEMAAFTADYLADDRAAFDEWITRHRRLAGGVDVHDHRARRFRRHRGDVHRGWRPGGDLLGRPACRAGPGCGDGGAQKLLVSREPVRPLFARVADAQPPPLKRCSARSASPRSPARIGVRPGGRAGDRGDRLHPGRPPWNSVPDGRDVRGGTMDP